MKLMSAPVAESTTTSLKDLLGRGFDVEGKEMIRDGGRRGAMIFFVDILARYEFESRSQQTYREHIRALRGNGQFRSHAVCPLAYPRDWSCLSCNERTISHYVQELETEFVIVEATEQACCYFVHFSDH